MMGAIASMIALMDVTAWTGVSSMARRRCWPGVVVHGTLSTTARRGITTALLEVQEGVT
jgi:hypothetical protein